MPQSTPGCLEGHINGDRIEKGTTSRCKARSTHQTPRTGGCTVWAGLHLRHERRINYSRPAGFASALHEESQNEVSITVPAWTPQVENCKYCSSYVIGHRWGIEFCLVKDNLVIYPGLPAAFSNGPGSGSEKDKELHAMVRVAQLISIARPLHGTLNNTWII
ncbi:hypothetical protein BJX96DRAFT_147793 [Aspergillus floccosus]